MVSCVLRGKLNMHRGPRLHRILSRTIQPDYYYDQLRCRRAKIYGVPLCRACCLGGYRHPNVHVCRPNFRRVAARLCSVMGCLACTCVARRHRWGGCFLHPPAPMCDHLAAEPGGHQKVLDSLNQDLVTVQNPDLKDYIKDVIPKVQKHLEKARELQSKLASTPAR